MTRLFNQDYSLAHPKVLVDHDRKRVADQIYQTLKNTYPLFPFAKARCLDVGSSSGIISHYLLKYVSKIHCIDTDSHAISLGKKLYQTDRLTFATFNGISIPSKNNSFDIVIFRRVYGSSLHPQKLVQEIYRVLKPGGLVFFEGHNKFFPLESDYKIPFLPLLPPILSKSLVILFGHKNYYLGKYQTYWGLKKLFSRFQISHLTPLIIKNPYKFKFTKLYQIGSFIKYIPLSILKLLEPFYPDFIWILKKGNHF